MATYAAFKHVELYNVGKAKKRVLKPPGGGNSDIFGGSLPSTPRSVRNNMASNIFGPPADMKNGNADRQGSYRYFFIDSAAKRPGESSHNRLFGDVERVPPTPKSYHRSNIPIGADGTDGAPKVTNGNGTMNGNGNGNGVATNGNGVAHENGNAKMNGTNGHINGSRDGNPVTGEGYKRVAAEINTTVPALNGAKQVINKNRIPPGGYSSLNLC